MIHCPVCQTENAASARTCAGCGFSPLTAPEGDAPILPAGTRLRGGAYTIGRLLGQGGFGITYQGSDTARHATVAIKEFFPSDCTRQGAAVVPAETWTAVTFAGATQEFLKEAHRVAQFHHPGIVRVQDSFEENHTAYMVMEYVEGHDLSKLIEEHGGRLDELAALDYIGPVAEALAAVHEAGLLHRDIKPHNVLVRADGRVILIDFGAAKEFVAGETQSQDKVLTPGYAPLEQYAGRIKLGAYTDLYALAATLYHLLTGQAPVEARDRARGIELPDLRQLNPDVSERVARAVMSGLAMRAPERPQSARRFLDDLGLRIVGPRLMVALQGPAHYRSIGAAIRAAPPGGARIRVRPGRYEEGLIVDKPVALIGEGPAEAIILAARTVSCLRLQTEYAEVRGFTLRQESSDEDHSAVEIAGGKPVLEACDLGSDSPACVMIHGAATDPVIRQCKIHEGKRVGVFVSEHGAGTLEACEISGHSAAGIRIGAGSTLVLRQCRVHQNGEHGLWVEAGGAADLDRESDLSGNRLGPWRVDPGGRLSGAQGVPAPGKEQEKPGPRKEDAPERGRRPATSEALWTQFVVIALGWGLLYGGNSLITVLQAWYNTHVAGLSDVLARIVSLVLYVALIFGLFAGVIVLALISLAWVGDLLRWLFQGNAGPGQKPG